MLESKAEHVNHNLVEEIAILRDLVVRINQMAEDELPLSELRRVLNSLSKASVRLVNLLQTEKALEQKEDPAAVLQNALAEMLRRLDLPGR